MKTLLAKLLDLGRPVGIGIFILLAGFVFFSKVRADNTIGDLVAQKALLQVRIEQAQAEYSKISEERQSAQEYCNIAEKKSDQLKQLAELNGARRSEIKVIDQKLSTMQSDLTARQ